MAYKLHYSDYITVSTTAPPDPVEVPGGPGFAGTPQPPDVPCDPTGDGWRGPPGPAGAPGVPGPPGGLGEAPVDGFGYGRLNAAWAQMLPLAGGTMTGPIGGLAGPSIALTGSGFILTGPNGLGIVSNFQSSGFPAFQNTKRMIFQNSAVAPGDFADFQFQRTTSTTGGSGRIGSVVRVLGTYGSGDASQNWNIASSATTTGSGLIVGIDAGATRNAGGTGMVMGGVLVAADNSGATASSGAGAVVGAEIDCIAQGVDDGGNGAMWGNVGSRIGLQIAAIRNNASITTPMTEVAQGIWFNTNGGNVVGAPGDLNTTFLSAIGFAVNTQTYQVLDTRYAIPPTGFGSPLAAVRMQHDQIIDFNGGASLKSVAGNYLQYRTATGRLYYVVGGVDQWSVDASGNVRARGTFTPSTTP